jgi:hypothetical protein
MVALGRPGAGAEPLARHGFEDVERFTVPFAWEFLDPESYARALASTGPAYEAIQAVGEDEFILRGVEVARGHVREGLPLRAPIDVVGYVARKPVARTSTTRRPAASKASVTGFLGPAEETTEVRGLFDEEVQEMGFVMNGSRLWAHVPAHQAALFELMGKAVSGASLTMRERGILVTASASTLGDSYCSLAWGQNLARLADADLAAGVLLGNDVRLSGSEQALAAWARRVAANPNGTDVEDVQSLRAVGTTTRRSSR